MSESGGVSDLTGAAGGAALARGIVAVSHVGRLVRASTEAEGPGSVVSVSIVDDGGEPWVLAPPWEEPPRGAARLHVSAPGAESGPRAEGAPPPVVLLAGRFESRVVETVRRLPGALRGALERHRACLDVSEWPALSVSRFVVASIGLAVPAGRRLKPLEPVPLNDYAASEPDLWLLQREAVLTHLNTEHAAALLEFARHSGHPAAAMAVAHEVDPLGLTLAVIGHDGAGYLRLPFSRPVGSPAEVGGALFG